MTTSRILAVAALLTALPAISAAQGRDNSAAPKMVGAVDANRLIPLGSGFNNAVPNLFLNLQIARGVRVAVETCASARHHQETWVKDGYFLIDASPIENPLLDRLMEVVTLKVGHFEVHYGDQHFRRKNVRVRLGGSMYKTARSVNNTLTSGDRAGSRYYDVLENTASNETSNAWSGSLQSGMRNMATAFVVNPSVKAGGAEFFGNVETITGAAGGGVSRRALRQLAGEGLYRFAGEKHLDFPPTDIRVGGKIQGFVVEGVVPF